jgi:WG containing repeat
MFLIAVLGAAQLMFSPAVFGQTVGLRQIQINSRWGGLGKPAASELTIVKQGSKFRLGDRDIDPGLLGSLETAVKEPDIPKINLANLGITPEWLVRNHAGPNTKYQGGPEIRAQNQRALYEQKFEDPSFITPLLSAVYTSGFHTDDYPSVQVQFTFEDGSIATVSSHSQQPFMLPWKVEFGGTTHTTYNANISRALTAMLPEDTVNRPRIAGEGLLDILREAVDRALESDLDGLDADNRAGAALAELKKYYSVGEPKIDQYHDVEFGNDWEGKLPHQTNLHVTLRKNSFPPNVSDAVVLLYEQGQVKGVEEFLKTAGKYEDLALSVPWLNQFIHDNPKLPVEISYVHNASFGDKAMRTFAGDMKARGRDDLVEQVRAQQSQIVLLTISGSYWLLFPDKHMMLWRYETKWGLLKWKPEDFPPGECADYQTNDGGCSGREVTPEGVLAAAHAPRDVACMAAHRATMRARETTDDLFPVMDHDKAGFINRTGKLIIPLCFDKLGDFSEGLARFERDGSWGYIDRSGTVVIEPKFPWAQEFSEGLAHVQVTGDPDGPDGKWGFIDKTGKLVIPPDYKGTFGGKSNIGSDDLGESFHDGLAAVEINGKQGFIDKTGNAVIPAEFKYAYPFSEGLAAATKSPSGNDGWGYIDATGKWVIAPQFQWASPFSDHLARVRTEHDCLYIDATGAVILRRSAAPTEKYCATGDFAEGLSSRKSGDKFGFVDQAGKQIIEPKFDFVRQFSDGLAAVRVGGKWGYIDKAGKMAVPLRVLDSAEDFHHGLAFVQDKDGRYGYIDSSGNYVWKPTLLYNGTD